MSGERVPERIRWAVRTMAPGPDDHLLEIGCGPGVAVADLCQRLAGGQIVAVDRSATAVGRAARRAAGCVAAGRAVLRTAALEELTPDNLLDGREGFDKVFAMNVNLFWVRAPVRELDLIRAVLKPGGALFLFYGYGTSGRGEPRVPEALFDHLADGGFAAKSRTGPSVLGVVATPVRSRRRRA